MFEQAEKNPEEIENQGGTLFYRKSAYKAGGDILVVDISGGQCLIEAVSLLVKEMELFQIVYVCGILGIASAELYPSYSYGQENRTPQKIFLRSKRQQCVCVSVFFPVMNSLTSSANFQCSCDPNGRPIGVPQQQQELQKELAQVQRSSTQNSQCGCQLNPAYTSTTESTTPWTAVSFGTTSTPMGTTTSPLAAADPNLPVYDCSCVNTGTGGSGGQPVPGQPQPVPGQPQPVPGQPQPVPGQPQPSCVEIIVKFSSERQFQCDCGNGPTIVGGQSGQNPPQGGIPVVDPYATPGPLPTVAPNAVQTNAPVQTTVPPVQTTVAPVQITAAPAVTTVIPSVINTTPSPYVVPDAEPDAVPCVMIQIRTGARVCACQENYKQCTDTACCNVKKFRSLSDDPSPSPSSKPNFIGHATATVDLLVDLLQKVRETLV
ncbi:hypothetical protein FO519_001842 [Halicephalobus sp. NKZ332]|nr:hypothetical protein FO519_001842 [Halicephalobus sp. NKZ332]